MYILKIVCFLYLRPNKCVWVWVCVCYYLSFTLPRHYPQRGADRVSHHQVNSHNTSADRRTDRHYIIGDTTSTAIFLFLQNRPGSNIMRFVILAAFG